jgi:hypothetical protein
MFEFENDLALLDTIKITLLKNQSERATGNSDV